MDALNGTANGMAHRFNRLESWAKQQRRAREEVELANSFRPFVTRKATPLLEDSSASDLWMTAYLNVLDQMREFGDQPYYVSSYNDRQYGRNFPFFISEQQLAIIRAQSRLVCTRNSYAVGLLTGLTSFVVGAGFTYRAAEKPEYEGANPELVKAVQKEIDLFIRRNEWTFLEQELFWRSREDGEFFLRYFQSDDDVLLVRTVEPEQIRQPPGSDYREWSFGIQSDPEDVVQQFAYFVHYMDSAGYTNKEEGEEVPVDQMLHFKVNTKRSIKRGLTDFSFDVYDALRAASKIRFNAGESSAVQAAIAQIRQWETATQSAVQNFANSQTDYSRTNPVTGAQNNFHEVDPGAIVDVPRGMTYVPPPGSAPGAMEAHEVILHVQLRAAGVRWNAPEWLATSSGADMAAYTASLTAENPFVKTSVRYQDQYEEAFTQVITRAVQVAIDAGRLPPDTLKRVDIQCEGPSIEAKNELQEAQANTLRIQGGWKSRQTVAQEEGLDFELEMSNMDEYQERFGGLVGAPGNEQPPENDDEDEEGKDENKDKGGQFESTPAPATSLTEELVQKPTDRSQLIIRAAAKLLAAARKPEAPAAPVVNIAPAQVKVDAPVVNVAPAAAPVVNVSAPAVTVEAPPAPVVNVAPPEVKVDVNLPGPKTMKIKRDKDGKISEYGPEAR